MLTFNTNALRNRSYLNSYINGKYVIVAGILTALLLTAFSLGYYSSPILAEDNGWLWRPATAWIDSTAVSYALNTLLILGAALFIMRINNLFGLIREHTYLPFLFFLLFTCCNPETSTLLNNGSVMNMIFLFALFLMFTTYQQKQSTGTAFIILFLLTSGSLFCSAYIYYLPFFLYGFHLLRASSLKIYLAALLGIVTPIWILWGCGILPDDFLQNTALPWSEIPDGESKYPLYCIMGATILLGLFTRVQGIFHFLDDKIQTRAYNKFVGMLAIVSAIFIIIDHTHSTNYLAILNSCAAFHTAHFFTKQRSKAAMIFFYIILALYLGLWIWSLLSN